MKLPFSISKVILLLVGAFLSTQALALEVTATVDKNPVMVDESFILDVSADDDLDVSAFDPSILMKDFVVGRTSVSRQTQMVNFNTTRITRWSTVLIPRKKGRYTIPELTVGTAKTQPIDIMVVPVSQSSNAQGRDIYIETDVDTKKAYLQTQIRYTAKLYLATDLQRGSLASPKVDDADIRQIGKDKEYSEIVGGRRYRVIERTFAIIPQKSGHFTITGPLFDGEVVDNNNSQSFGFFKRTKSVNRVGPSIDIDVLPVPDNYTEHWLPSDFVQLTEEWTPKTGEFKVGEPITRVISLTAVGLVEEQLPAINSHYPDSVKTYPDQPETATVQKDGNLIAQRTESIAIIPGKAGDITIPAVSVPWFNVVTGKTEYAHLSQRTIHVVAGAPSTNTPPAPLPITDASGNGSDAAEHSAPAKVIVQQGYWSISSTILLILWIITLLLWWLQLRKKLNQSKQTKDSVKPDATNTSALVTAINKKEVADILPLLTTWLAGYCGKPNQSLAQSQQQINDTELNQHISAMLATRYATKATDWNKQALINKIRELEKNNRQKTQQISGLAPLHPEQ
ncbi:protein BatD [Neptunicella marina]|uniref:Protein BatD n=2 Tax=Neptunicella marina TaxID=2125989 RepID=A0A8J6LZP5_9ALTE|nr:protein BatD [Neptunicella marina]